MPAYDGSIRIDTRVDERGLNKGIQSITGSLGKLAVAMGVAFSVAALFNFGKSAVDVAAQMSNAFIGLESVVTGQGKSFEQAKKFINDFIDDGLVPAADAVTAYKNLSMRGYDTTQIEKTLIALKDSAAFGRQASLSIGEAVRGATEGLKNENSILVDNAGVTKNVSIMWKEYAAQIGTTVGMLTKEQKIQAEVNGILNETRFQTGDAAKLASNYSGQLSALGVSFTNLKVAIGNILIPIIQKLLPIIKAAVDGLVFFFNQIAQIVNLLLGTNIGVAQTAEGMGAVADTSEAAADAQGELADNTKAAGKAAKGALAAFDQLNVIQQDMGGADIGAVDTPTPTGDLGLGELAADGGAFDAISDKAEKVRMFLQPLIDVFGRLREALIPLGKTIWEGLMWAWENILVPLGTWIITEVLPRFLDILAIRLDNLNLAIEALKPFAIWLWENFLKPAAEWTGEVIIAGLDWLIERLKDLNKWIQNNQDAFAVIAGTIALVIAVLFLMSSPIAMVIAGIAAIILIIANWGAIWDWIVEKITYAWEVLKMIWGIVAWWFRTKVFEPMADVAAWALNSISEKFRSVFDGIANFVKGTINRIIDFINGMIEAVTSGINAVISGVNSIGGSLPGYSPIQEVPVAQIPRLATGAVIPPNSEFLAVLGDQKSGRNIEAPEGLIRQIIQEEMSKMRSEVNITFTGSLAALAQVLKPEIDKENTRVGGSLVAGGMA